MTTLNNVHVVDNTAAQDGGGIYNFTFTGAPEVRLDSTMTIIESTVDGNSAGVEGEEDRNENETQALAKLPKSS